MFTVWIVTSYYVEAKHVNTSAYGVCNMNVSTISVINVMVKLTLNVLIQLYCFLELSLKNCRNSAFYLFGHLTILIVV